MANQEPTYTLNQNIRQCVTALQKLAQRVAHDTNNYYGVIQGYVSLLEMGGVQDDTLQKALNAIGEAVDAGVAFNRSLASFYRSAALIAMPVKPGDLAREVCSEYSKKQNYSVAIEENGAISELPLDEPAVRAIIESLCILAQKTNTEEATLALASVNLEATAISSMVFDSAPGDYLQLRMDFAVNEDEPGELSFLDPFIITSDVKNDLGLARIFPDISRHQGNLDIIIEDRKASLVLYFPKKQG